MSSCYKQGLLFLVQTGTDQEQFFKMISLLPQDTETSQSHLWIISRIISRGLPRAHCWITNFNPNLYLDHPNLPVAVIRHSCQAQRAGTATNLHKNSELRIILFFLISSLYYMPEITFSLTLSLCILLTRNWLARACLLAQYFLTPISVTCNCLGWLSSWREDPDDNPDVLKLAATKMF